MAMDVLLRGRPPKEGSARRRWNLRVSPERSPVRAGVVVQVGIVPTTAWVPVQWSG